MPWILAFLFACTTPIDDPITTTIAGTPISGQIQRFDAEGVVVETEDGAQRIALDQLAIVDFGRRIKNLDGDFSIVELIDDSVLIARTFTVKNRIATLRMDSGATADIKIQNLRFVRFRNYPRKSQLLKKWNELSRIPPKSGDAVVVNRSDDLETLEGVVDDVEKEKVGFQMDDQTARISRKKIEGIVFYHAAGRDLINPECKVYLTDGAVVNARSIEHDPDHNDQIIITTVAGSKPKLPIGSLSRIDFSLANSAYLSSLTPTSSDWKPLIASSAILSQLRTLKLPRVNQSFKNQPLSLLFYPDENSEYFSERREFKHGFALAGGSKMAFALEGKYTELTGFVGFDPVANRSGNVSFKIRCDGKVKFEKQLLNEKLNPQKIQMDIEGVQRLVIEVDYHDGRAIGDVVHFCDAKVAK